MNSSFGGMKAVLALAAACLITVPQIASARGGCGYGGHSHGGYGGHSHGGCYGGGYSHCGGGYYSGSYCGPSIVLGFGAGYYGRPWGSYYGSSYYAPSYYAPSYYYARPYYRYGAAYRANYYANNGHSVTTSVQAQLARHGYYRGSIDGAIGPRSRQAIASYQSDHGLAVTGTVTGSLLRSLGLA